MVSCALWSAIAFERAIRTTPAAQGCFELLFFALNDIIFYINMTYVSLISTVLRARHEARQKLQHPKTLPNQHAPPLKVYKLGAPPK